ncbi:MAG: DNA-binding response regulator [Terrisporobacter sp.]|uniref:DNA-binding response regulator n=1 Tax=Terrisporobacter sp. TaxID=1965305 RepID=UPI002A91DB4E|nr:DNA-binding response regulator [Terrisporobacter sp.]MDY6152217.1 DNA-binding response regulator [Terrisporobacter sp.]
MCINKNEVGKLYITGYDARQISEILCVNVESVRKCIQRNYSHFRNRHQEALRERKDSIKAINYECNRFISDKSFVQKNRSIYKTKENGDIVLNEDLGYIFTADTPRRLNNEFKGCY